MTLISYLILSVILFLVMVVAEALMAMMQHKLAPLAGSRDNLPHPGVLLGRAKRARANMLEGMIMFVPLALLVIHTGGVSPATTLAGTLFFFGRLAYAPLYWFGVPWLRTIAWAVSIGGILRLVLSLLPLI